MCLTTKFDLKCKHCFEVHASSVQTILCSFQPGEKIHGFSAEVDICRLIKFSEMAIFKADTNFGRHANAMLQICLISSS